MRTLFPLTLTLLFAPALAARADFSLVEQGAARVAIVPGADDAFAARTLAAALRERSGVEVPVVPADEWTPDARGAVLVGSVASNRHLADLAARHGLDLSPDTLTEDGYVLRTLTDGGRPVLVAAGGGRRGAIYAVSDLKNLYLSDTLGTSELDVREVPALKYRWLWTWDWRMDWDGTGRGGDKMGGGRYPKDMEGFLTDYQRCIDFMAEHRLNGLIIWGFLRDAHGGAAAAQELCAYAAERGVRILPGVGTSGYEGYYFEGKHRFNASTWIAERPERRAVGADGQPHNVPCPSRPENQAWLDEGAKWLFDTFQIGGVNLEMGDFFVCYCDHCRARRAQIDSDEADYYKDMAISHSVTLRTMRALAPEAWLSYATYTGFTREMMEKPPQFRAIIPEDALCQWTLTDMAGRWEPGLRPPTRHNVGYLHWANKSTHTEQDFFLDGLAEVATRAAAEGFEGLAIYGEDPATRVNMELNYLALAEFCYHPGTTVEEFIDRRVAPRWGGREAARRLLEIVPLVRNRPARQNGENLRRALALAQSFVVRHESAAPDDGTTVPDYKRNGTTVHDYKQARERWERFAAQLAAHLAEWEAAEAERKRIEAEIQVGVRREVAELRVSSEDPKYPAARLLDGNVAEPAGLWQTERTNPTAATVELRLTEAAPVDRVILYHQLNPGYYRSRDYHLDVWVEDGWKSVATVTDNTTAGWVAHVFDPVTTDRVRLVITRSEYGNRMGCNEIEVRYAPPP